jgi:hypothetical protein
LTNLLILFKIKNNWFWSLQFVILNIGLWLFVNVTNNVFPIMFQYQNSHFLVCDGCGHTFPLLGNLSAGSPDNSFYMLGTLMYSVQSKSLYYDVLS